MIRTLITIGVMFLVATCCLGVSRWLKPGSVLARLNEFVGRSIGMMAVGLLFLLLYVTLFPRESATARALRVLSLRIDTLTLRVDSLTRR